MAAKRVYQFRISLNDTDPEIWRLIQVPEDYSFWDFHVAIQDAMGWLDSHLHEFRFPNRPELIGIPYDEFEGGEVVLPGWDVKLADYFDDKTKDVFYEYDFGDSWEHTVSLDALVPAEAGVKYPRCLDGAGACPPEDCGGTHGYDRLLEIMQDPKDKEYASMVSWCGVFDPKKFSVKIRFSDPQKRLKMMLDE